MKEQEYGRIVNIASIAGKEGNPNASPYSASKAGVIGFTKSLGKELASFNIAVNCITPATAQTRILEQLTPEFIEYMRVPAFRVDGSSKWRRRHRWWHGWCRRRTVLPRRRYSICRGAGRLLERGGRRWLGST